jgi:tetratricopeptide (TPR) repeat protein
LLVKVVLGRLTVDAEALVIAKDGQPISAPPKVVELILALGQRPGEVLSKEALMERLWPQGYADDAALWQTIYLARKLLAKTGQATIETQPRRGYLLVCAEPPRARNVWRPALAAMGMGLVAAIGVFPSAPRSAPSSMSSATLRAYNLGRYYVHEGTLASVEHAITELQSVVRDAPADARGYAGLAEAEVLFAQQTDRGRHRMLAHATKHANAALRIDAKSAAAHAALAAAAFYDGAPAGKVEAAFQRAIALDDTYAPSHMYYGEFLLTRGDLRGAYAQLRRATDIDPSLGDANVLLAKVAYQLGDPRTAIHYAREGLGFGAPDKLDAYQTLGYSYVAVRQPKSALRVFRQLRSYVPQAGAAGAAYVQSRIRGRGLQGE